MEFFKLLLNKLMHAFFNLLIVYIGSNFRCSVYSMKKIAMVSELIYLGQTQD